jgi:hypothetical protein
VGLAGGAVKLRENVLVAAGERISVATFRRLPHAWLGRASGRVLALLLGRVAGQRLAASVARAAPLAIGVAAGAGFDWLAVTGLGRAAIRYYGKGGPVARAAANPSPPLPADTEDRLNAHSGD